MDIMFIAMKENEMFFGKLKYIHNHNNTYNLLNI